MSDYNFDFGFSAVTEEELAAVQKKDEEIKFATSAAEQAAAEAAKALDKANASLISNIGEDQAIKVVRGWVNNLSTKVFSSDTLALKAVQAGQCDATIVNSYYLGRLLVDDEGTNLNLVWANQGSTGVHVNISGGGLVRYSKKSEAAINLLEWLTSEWAQEKYAYLNLEYPVVQGTKIHPILESWGSFKEDDLNAKLLGALQRDAVLLARKTNYD